MFFNLSVNIILSESFFRVENDQQFQKRTFGQVLLCDAFYMYKNNARLTDHAMLRPRERGHDKIKQYTLDFDGSWPRVLYDVQNLQSLSIYREMKTCHNDTPKRKVYSTAGSTTFVL